MQKPAGLMSAAAVALLLAATPAAGQEFTLSLDTARIQFGGRVQSQFTTTTVDEVPTTDFLLRRVRLEAKVQLNGIVSGKIQPEFAGSRVSLKDAFVRFDLDPAFAVVAGQMYRPFGRIAQTSSLRILPVERGLRIRGVKDGFDEYNLMEVLGYSERDVGLQVKGAPKGAPLGLSYSVGAFDGPLQIESPDFTPLQFAARVEGQPVKPLKVGLGWSNRQFARIDEELGEVEVERGNAWEVDFELGRGNQGLNLLGEATIGDFDPFVGARFFGAQGWLGYRFAPVSGEITGVEPLLRVSYGDPDREDDLRLGVTGGTLVTPGVNIWLGGLNRVQLNYDVWIPEEGDTESSFKAQFQMAF